MATETFAIPVSDDAYVVYAPLRRTAFVANTSMVRSIAAVQAGRCDRSSDEDGAVTRLLDRLGLTGGHPDDPPGDTVAGLPRPVDITLLLTTECNLRCTYCYARAGDTPRQRMSLAVAKRGIRFVLANALDEGASTVTVNYHGGGEPTMNWTVLRRSLEFARSEASGLGIRVIGAAATNGVLGDRQVDWIIANLDGGVTVSYDGLPVVHDRHRTTAAGGGSSQRVLRTLKRLDEAGYGYGIRVTVTREDIAQLPASIDFICSQFRPAGIQVEPAYQLGRWRDAPSADTSAFLAAFRLAQDVARRHGQAIAYSAARPGLMTSHFCGVSQDNFCLSPSGNVSACYEAFSEADDLADVFFYGFEDSRGGYRFDAATLDRLRHRTVQHLEWCQGCFAKWDCAGDCYYKALATAGRAEYRGSQRCHITREITKYLLLDRIRDAGGVLWHEPPDRRAAVGTRPGREKQGLPAPAARHGG